MKVESNIVKLLTITKLKKKKLQTISTRKLYRH
jgi:hypothetical protein